MPDVDINDIRGEASAALDRSRTLYESGNVEEAVAALETGNKHLDALRSAVQADAHMKRLHERLLNAKGRTLPPGPKLEYQYVSDSVMEVAGYGVIYSDYGLDGAKFEEQTSLKLPGQTGEGLFAVQNPPVYFDHGFDEILGHQNFGFVNEAMPDEKGLWIKAMLDRHAMYMDYVEPLLVASALGWSGGSTWHLNTYIGDTRLQWPVIEFSLTPTPAQPKTLGVELVQTLTPKQDSLALLQRWEKRQGVLVAADSQGSAEEGTQADRAVKAEQLRRDILSAQIEIAMLEQERLK